MSNEITLKDEAMKFHTQIGMYAEQVNTSVYNLGKAMATMKERELYKALNYESFEAYCEREWGLKRSQSAKFISVYNNLGKDYIQEHGSLGVSKLYLLSQLDDDDRAVIEATAEDSSVREMQEQIKKLKEENEKLQCSFFDMEKEKEAAEELAEEAESKLKEVMNQPTEVAVSEPDPEEIEKLAEEKAKEITAVSKKRIDELSEKLSKIEDEKKKMQSQIEKASILETKNAELQAKVDQSASETDNIKKAYDMKLENLQKKLDEAEKANSTHVELPPEADEATIFKLKMENFLPVLNGIITFVNEADSSEELKSKLKGALEKIILRL